MNENETLIWAKEALSNLPNNASTISDFFSTQAFLIPFLSTLCASLTILLLGFFKNYSSDKKKKIFAITLMADTSSRILESNLIILKHTTIPHIEATKKILDGDYELLNTMFLADEFDILTDKTPNFTSLPESYRVLIGCDDIILMQVFETILYSSGNDVAKTNLNEFVKNNLKSQNEFNKFPNDKKLDVLTTYWDLLDKIKHDNTRTIFFIKYILLPAVENYRKSKQFIFFRQKSLNNTIVVFNRVFEEYESFLPPMDFLENVKHGGIQKVV